MAFSPPFRRTATLLELRRVRVTAVVAQHRLHRARAAVLGEGGAARLRVAHVSERMARGMAGCWVRSGGVMAISLKARGARAGGGSTAGRRRTRAARGI